jgi:hypothetical protein
MTALAMTCFILFASHIAFFCVCFPAGLTSLNLNRGTPRGLPTLGQQLSEAWPWLAGVVTASATAYWLTGRILERYRDPIVRS